MIDLHTHLLPGMDDGSDSVETSLAMLRQCAGVEGICATPHFYADRDAPDRFLRRRAEAWERLRAALPADCLRIRLGAEVRYFDGLSRAEALPELCIEGTKLLLLEMPFGRWTERMLTEVEGICRRGLQPVAAHIERYMGLVPKGLLRAFTELDILLQCNAEFSWNGGRRERRCGSWTRAAWPSWGRTRITWTSGRPIWPRPPR